MTTLHKTYLANKEDWQRARMKLTLFEMERLQSTWENVVRYNLSESGVHPLKLRELLALGGQAERILDYGLGYSQSNGTPELRGLIAQGYPGASEENILVTNGSSEANFVSVWRFLESGDEAAILLPNYMQTFGLATTIGARARPFHLREETGAWVVDEEELRSAINKRTKLIVLCNPDNPTGAVLGKPTLQLVADLASEVGAWVLSDEVYQGTERHGSQTPSMWDLYDKVLAVNGLSKAYGLPGLRIGWVAGPKEIIADLWAYHDYTTIGPTYLSDRLAQIALEPGNRKRILERTRGILRNNYPILEAWIRRQSDLFHLIEPPAGAVAFMRYNLPINSSKLAHHLIEKKSVLVVPGDHFGMDGFVRIGFGDEEHYLRAGLDLVLEGLNDLRKDL